MVERNLGGKKFIAKVHSKLLEYSHCIWDMWCVAVVVMQNEDVPNARPKEFVMVFEEEEVSFAECQLALHC